MILNPTVLVEILSPGTEAFDRGAKFDRYQTWTKTLTDYVLVSQDEPRIERYCRQDDGSWKYQRHAGIDTSVSLDSIRCTLRLADAYDRVRFPAAEEQTAEASS